MDKNTLSNYGWIVICVLVLAVMIALSTPFGNYVKSAVENTTEGLFDTSEKALNVVGMSAGEGSFGGSGTSTPTKDPALNPSGAIPEGATYTKADGTVLNAGDSFPTIAEGDIYTYGDYTYEITPSALDTFGFASVDAFKENCLSITGMTWDELVKYSEANGMSKDDVIESLTSGSAKVSLNTNVVDKNQTSYGVILESINGSKITSMQTTFYGCSALTTAPAIPGSVTNMDRTFYGCTSLTTAPELPKNLNYMQFTFRGCTALTTAPDMSNATYVTNMGHAFSGCTSLKTYKGSSDSDGDFSNYIIPNSVTTMSSTFSGCTALTTAPAIPSSVTDIQDTFKNCTALTTAPAIPNSITKMINTFRGCTALTTAPDMSKATSLTTMSWTFEGCTSLTAISKIPSSVTIMYRTFSGCSTLTNAPAIPSSVTDMLATFADCTSITGEISIPCSLASKNYTYTNCPATITYYHIDSCDSSCGA